MPGLQYPLWDIVVDRRSPALLLTAVSLAAAGLAARLFGGSTGSIAILVRQGLYTAAGAVAVLLVRRLVFSPRHTVSRVLYHSDDDGFLIAPARGPVARVAWDRIVEVRETLEGALVLTTPQGNVRLPRRVARRDAFGMAVFERVVPRLAGELWNSLVTGRMVPVSPEGRRMVPALVAGLAVGAAFLIPGGLMWAGAVAAVAVLLFLATRSRMRGVFLSARGVGDRDGFIAWEAADVTESARSLIIRDTDSGWVARIPRTVVNYHAIAVVARAAQALSGSGVESVAFRSANDSGRVRIVVEGSVPSGEQYH